MTIISGIFTNPFGEPLANVTLRLLARGTTSQSFSGTNAAAVTAADGSYSMSVLVGTYAVSAIINRSEDYLGVIQVYSDSADGTLNDFLTSFNQDEATPEVLQEMQELLKEAQDAAATAEAYALIPCGEFNADTAYATNDLVEYAGSEYRATADTAGVAPPENPWELFVSAGADGQQGEKGDTGPANSLSIGTVTTLDAGSDATAEITGDAPNQTLSLGIPRGADGEMPEGVLNYREFWSPDETYNVGDVVKTSGGVYEGLYECVWGPTSENPTDSIDWERIAGFASSIDGTTSAGGNLLYNRVDDVPGGTYTLQSTGELSWTLNVSGTCTIDIATLMSDTNANPAAVVRLVIVAVKSLTVSLTGASAWWQQDSGHTPTAPTFTVDATQPLTIIEVSRITNATEPGALVRQVYPVISDSVQTINGNAPTAGNVAISAQTGYYNKPSTNQTYAPTGAVLVEAVYINEDKNSVSIDLSTIAAKNTNGTLWAGYELRIFAFTSVARTLVISGATAIRFNGGASGTALSISLVANMPYVFSLFPASTGSFWVCQHAPLTLPDATAVTVAK
ncbi:prophage tail fiber N-terminal domain-containing protein [Klebsiella aerogenes]